MTRRGAVALVAVVGLLGACTGGGDGGGADEAAPVAEPGIVTTTTREPADIDTPAPTVVDPDRNSEVAPFATSTIAPTTTTAPPSADPALRPRGTDGDGFVRLALDPERVRWSGELVPNAGNPYHEIRTDERAAFLFVAELYPDAGLAWDGDTGVVATSCPGSGICVYLDPDDDGPADLLVADGGGTVTIDEVDDGSYRLTFSTLRFPADGGGGYLVDPFALAI